MNDKIYRLLSYVKNEDITDSKPLSKEEVNSIMKRFKKENCRTKKITYRKRRIVTVAAIAAVMAVIVPTSVYAYSRYYAHIDKTNTYQNTVVIKPAEKISDSEVIPDSGEESSVKETDYKYWRFTYLPEGLKKNEWDFKYSNQETGESITPFIYYLPYVGNEIKEEMNFSANCENYESDGKTVMINYRLSYEKEKDDPTNFGRVVWIAFNDTDYVLELCISNGLPQEELYKIIEGTELYSINEDTFYELYGYGPEESTEDTSDESTEDTSDDSSESFYVSFGKTALEKCNIYGTGQFVEFPNYGDFRIRVNTVEITDSFDGITTGGAGDECDFSSWADENNNIIPNTRTWYKYGDGISTIDEDICSVDMPYHIIKMNLTAENTGNDFEEICICPDLVNFNSSFNTVIDFEEDLNIPEGYSRTELGFRDSIFEELNVDPGGFISLDSAEKNYCIKNYIGLEAGESADFQICFLCSENMLNDVYMRFYYVDEGMPLFKIEK